MDESSRVQQTLLPQEWIPTVLVLAIGVPWAFVAGAECPTSALICEATDRFYYERIDTTEPQASLTCAGFDLALGRFFVTGGSGDPHGSSAEANLSDTFLLLGPELGAEIHLVVEVHLTGNAIGGIDAYYCGSGSVSAQLKELESHEETNILISAPGGYDDYTGVCSGRSVPIDHRLQLPVQVVAGQPFSLQISARGAGSKGGSGSAVGQLGFVGMTPGMSIVSCQGFSQETPVQLFATTWGRMKSLYR